MQAARRDTACAALILAIVVGPASADDMRPTRPLAQASRAATPRCRSRTGALLTQSSAYQSAASRVERELAAR